MCTANGIPASRILRFARTRRWAIADAGTANAAAIGAAIAPWPLGLTGATYGVVAVAMTAAFAVLAIQVLLNRATDPAQMRPEKRLFAFSILYLFALFGALVLDKML